MSKSLEELTIEELKELYLQKLGEFMKMRNREYEGEVLPLQEGKCYVHLVDNVLHPIQEKLDTLGEGTWIDDHPFDYEY